MLLLLLLLLLVVGLEAGVDAGGGASPCDDTGVGILNVGTGAVADADAADGGGAAYGPSAGEGLVAAELDEPAGAAGLAADDDDDDDDDEDDETMEKADLTAEDAAASFGDGTAAAAAAGTAAVAETAATGAAAAVTAAEAAAASGGAGAVATTALGLDVNRLETKLDVTGFSPITSLPTPTPAPAPPAPAPGPCGSGCVALDGRCERMPLALGFTPPMMSTISLPLRLSYSSKPVASRSSSFRCVSSTWCATGVGQGVGLAVR